MSILPLNRATYRIRDAVVILGVLFFASIDWCATLQADPYNRKGRMADLPNIMLWAWERPEDLRFLHPDSAGVAFLAKTLLLRGNRVFDRPRLQPLQLAEGTSVVAVIRIETFPHLPRVLDSRVEEETIDAMVQVVRLKGISAIQVDFDATASERPFYSRVLRTLRSEIPDSVGLSITALASWCLGDRWVDSLPIDEAVPMLFRMGADQDRILYRLRQKRDFSSPACRNSIGISTDEPMPSLPKDRRTYIFNPFPWSRDSYRKAMAELNYQ